MHFLFLSVLFIPVYSWGNGSEFISQSTDNNEAMMGESLIVDQTNMSDSNITQKTVDMRTTYSTTLSRKTVDIDIGAHYTTVAKKAASMDTSYYTQLHEVTSTVYQVTTEIESESLLDCDEIELTCNYDCSCNIWCIVFGDCCYSFYTDVLELESNEEIVDVTLHPFATLQKYVSMDKNEMLPIIPLQQYGKCTMMKTSNTSYMYQIIKTCPRGFNNEFVIAKCMKMSDENIWNIPVFTNVSDIIQVTFRNIFCAYCHGYTVDEVTFWKASFHCNLGNDTNIQHHVKNDECMIQARPPPDTIKPYRCLTDFRRYKACPSAGVLNSESDISRILCSAYIDPVYVNNEGYKNKNCLTCFEVKDFLFTCPIEPTERLSDFYPGLDIFFSYDKNVLSSSNKIDFTIDCRGHERFDFLTMSCKSANPIGSQQLDNACMGNVSMRRSCLNCSEVISYSNDEFEIVNDVLLINGHPLNEDTNYSITNNTLFICLDTIKILNCLSLITYGKDEYDSINNTLFINGNMADLHPTEYFEKNGTLYVCKTDNGPHNAGSIDTVTNVCVSVSVMSLLVVIMFHIKYTEFQNLHGRNITCLSSSLLLAQSVFLACRLVHLPPNVVPILSIIQHFSWLSVFGWNAVISFDIARRLIIMSGSVNQSRQSLRFRIYFCLAFGVPVVGVSVCALLHFKISEKIIGYGQDGNCWISERNGLLFAFIIPVITALFFSVCCFLVILYTVESTRRATAIATSNHKDRNTCAIYFKLFLMIGLSWIIGIISSNLESMVLSYINGILNGLQGFFLTFVCLCNCRVIRIVRNKRDKEERTSSVSARNNTSV